MPLCEAPVLSKRKLPVHVGSRMMGGGIVLNKAMTNGALGVLYPGQFERIERDEAKRC